MMTHCLSCKNSQKLCKCYQKRSEMVLHKKNSFITNNPNIFFLLFKFTIFFSTFIGTKRITELEYFLGQVITISNSAHPTIHLSYSEQEKGFIFANSNVSPLMFNYRDDARITCSNGSKGSESGCESYKITLAEKDMCEKEGTVVPCESNSQTTWQIEKKQFGFTISTVASPESDKSDKSDKKNDKKSDNEKEGLCLTKNESLSPQLTKCTGDASQIFDFALSIICTDPAKDLRNRVEQTPSIDMVIRNVLTQMGFPASGSNVMMPSIGGGSTMPVASAVTPDGRHVDFVPSVNNGAISTMPITGSSTPYLRNTSNGLQPIFMPMTSAMPVTAATVPVTAEMYNTGHVTTPQGYSYMTEGTLQDPSKKYIHTDPLHQRIRRVKPAKTRVETKTVPVKMRVETREEPTIISVDRRMMGEPDEVVEESGTNNEEKEEEEGEEEE
ncbi:hypothetical protein M153_806000257 [Pseudoloma neurophilia]|uniref:Uncharacterized protein n=1 Tax=Pseudoloma neurophilia TaxID=146866 RepID=A0A0R0M533_9MICR|nr:hypothetical protein M153_806000257 [Pseudoloma neurophilia]